MGTLGELIGGAFATILLGLLCGLAFKSKEPDQRAVAAALCAWVCASILAGFGMADGGPFRFDASLRYLPGAIAAFFYLRWHYGKMWSEEQDETTTSES